MIKQQVESVHNKNGEIFRIIDTLEGKFSSLEPDVQSFVPEINRFSRIRKEAGHLLNQYPNPAERPSLFGLFVGVKDIFHVDSFPTRAGSTLPPSEITGNEGEFVSRLKKLGVIIFGKTITTEFAYFAPGPTRNPHNLEHTPGGSSSGSAAAVAAGIVPFALGTQTIGSIIRPASYCGVFGYKPTYGRISTDGLIPLAPSVDTVGFFTRNAKDAEFLSRLIINDWQTSNYITGKPILGIPIGPYLDYADSEMRLFFREFVEKLKFTGYPILNVPSMGNFEQISKNHNKLVAYEAAKTHEFLFRKYKKDYHPKTVELIEYGKQINENEYKHGLESRYIVRDILKSLQKESGIDLWLSPPAQGAALKGINNTGNPVMNLPWTHCGFPTINIPAGVNQGGLPLGLQVSASTNQDEALLNWAIAISKDITHSTNH